MLEFRLKLWDPSALKCGALRIPEWQEGSHLNLGLSTALFRMGRND